MADENKNSPALEAEKANDLQNRVKSFNEKLMPLLKEFRLGLGAVPLILADGRLAAQPKLFDDSHPQSEDKEESKLSEA